MNSGLSLRTAKLTSDLAPTPTASTPQSTPDTTTVDLSNAQNECVRPELLDILRYTIDDGMTIDTFQLPTAPGGDPRLRETLSVFFNRYFKPMHHVEAEHIALTAGASDAIEHAVHALCDEGDSIIVPGPYWPGFELLVSTRAKVNIIIAQSPTYTNYTSYLVPSLQAAYDFSPVKKRIKAVLLSNPSNPLGRCYSKSVLIECMEFCQERGLHLISDELYALTDLGHIKKGEEFVSVLSLTEPLMPEGAIKVDPTRVHVVWSASKLFGVSGLRVGCFVSQQNPELVKAVAFLTATHTNTIASLYLSRLLSLPQLSSLLTLNSERLTTSYRLLAECLRNLKIHFVEPTHGLFLFAKLTNDLSTLEEEKSYFDRLTAAGLKVSPGRLYRGVDGEFGWARIRFCIAEDVMTKTIASFGQIWERERRRP
ncbi:uncharacterized protein EKO05_0005929 [Ascochyta rabiei]|uniref:uncharacterized protein n=1 Tax=Didymella rabiei TaxID=5454 RepID=UPI00220D7567|nr:uncharacterized protein EKO05_0005929 [Ascochyta rabiei]UPX15483.1 hypothetical protein EKO05_0005929 [Ascochyta rabiei]